MATTQLPHSTGDPVGHDRLCGVWGRSTHQFSLALLMASCPRDSLSGHREMRAAWAWRAALPVQVVKAPPDPWAPLPRTLLPEAAEG